MVDFVPICTDIDYLSGNDRKKQILVCTLSDPRLYAINNWVDKSAAIFELTRDLQLDALIRDLLANPQIRALVIDGEGQARALLEMFWGGHIDQLISRGPRGMFAGIPREHLDLVRMHVGLYNNEFVLTRPMLPYMMKPLKYTK